MSEFRQDFAEELRPPCRCLGRSARMEVCGAMKQILSVMATFKAS